MSKPFDEKKFLEMLLRGSYRKTPMYNQALNLAKEEYSVLSKTGKPMTRIHYKCAICQNYFDPPHVVKDEDGKTVKGPNGKPLKTPNLIAVDHILPVVDPVIGYIDANTYISRLLVPVEGVQVLCNYKLELFKNGTYNKPSCHYLKTQAENMLRPKKPKKEKKPKKKKG